MHLLQTSRRQVVLLLALGALTVLPSLPARDLWNPDEPRYAEVAREMRVRDEFLVPHLNDEVYAEKPPLHFWLSAALQATPAGVNGGRVVSGLAFLGTLLLVWSLGRRWWGDRAGLLAAGVLATFELFARLGRFGVIDVLLTFFTTLAAWGWLRHREGARGAIVAFWAGLALSVLAKGPVGIAVAVLAIAGAAAARVPAAPRGRAHFVWGPLLALGLIAAWLVPACIAGGPAYRDAILFKQTVGRMAESWSHQRPWWYYAQYLVLNHLPWALFLPFAAAWAWRRGGAARAMLLWFGFGLLFFSLLSGKRERYLLPLAPALALVLGAWLDAAAQEPPGRWLVRTARVFHGIFAGAGIAFVLFAVVGRFALKPYLEKDSEVAEAFLPLATLPRALLLLPFGAALFWCGRSGRRAARAGDLGRVAALGVGGMLLLLLGNDIALTPQVNRFKSPRPVAEELNEWQGDGPAAAFPSLYAGSYNLYSGRLHIEVLTEPPEVQAWLAAPERRLVLVAKREYDTRAVYEGRTLKEHLTVAHWVTALRRVGNREMVFLTNYDPGPLAEEGATERVAGR